MAYPDEKRQAPDRRRCNFGPPYGCEERRKRRERRHTFVDEIQLSDNDWKNYFHTDGPPRH